MNIEIFKPRIRDLIKLYYEKTPENGAGGHLHIVLDDGNIEHANILWCREGCQKAGDKDGVFIANVLLCFSEEELQDMYDKDWWGMDKTQ
jgi:hypothetical protein